MMYDGSHIASFPMATPFAAASTASTAQRDNVVEGDARASQRQPLSSALGQQHHT